MDGDGGYQDYCHGTALLEQGDYEGALRVFQNCTNQHPHFKTEWRIMQCLRALGQHEVASEHLERAYALNQANSQVSTEYAQMIASRGETDRARAILHAILEKQSCYGPARRALAAIDD